MTPIVIKEAQAAARLLVKEVKKAAGKDGVLDAREKGRTYGSDKVVGKAMYAFEKAMHHHWWGGEGGVGEVTVDHYRRAVQQSIGQLKAIDSYATKTKTVGDGNGVVTEKEIKGYARTNGHLPLWAKTLVSFMIEAKRAGKLG